MRFIDILLSRVDYRLPRRATPIRAPIPAYEAANYPLVTNEAWRGEPARQRVDGTRLRSWEVAGLARGCRARHQYFAG